MLQSVNVMPAGHAIFCPQRKNNTVIFDETLVFNHKIVDCDCCLLSNLPTMYCTGDVDGSLEAILDILETYNSPQCQLHLLSYGVGNINESDVEMAAMFNGKVVICTECVKQNITFF